MSFQFHDKRSATGSQVYEVFGSGGTQPSEIFDAVLPRSWAGYASFQFENLVGLALSAFSFNAQVTRATADRGVDILLRDQRGASAVVQCKCYASDATIGPAAVRDLIGCRALEATSRAILVSTCKLTTQAAEHALKADVGLLVGVSAVNQFLSLAERRARSSDVRTPWPTIDQLCELMNLLTRTSDRDDTALRDDAL